MTFLGTPRARLGAVVTDTVFRLVLATLGFAVFTNVADDSGEFRDMRRISGRQLTQGGARRNHVRSTLAAVASKLILEPRSNSSRYTRMDDIVGLR